MTEASRKMAKGAVWMVGARLCDRMVRLRSGQLEADAASAVA